MKNKKMVIQGLLAVLGVILAGIGLFLLKGENIKSISGVCIGVGAGIFGMSLSGIITSAIERANPGYAKKMEIEENDERNVAISHAAKAKAYDWMLYILAIVMLVFVLMGVELLPILLLVAAYLLVVGVFIFYLSKYTKEM